MNKIERARQQLYLNSSLLKSAFSVRSRMDLSAVCLNDVYECQDADINSKSLAIDRHVLSAVIYPFKVLCCCPCELVYPVQIQHCPIGPEQPLLIASINSSLILHIEIVQHIPIATSVSARTPIYFLCIGGPNFMEDTDHPAYAKLAAVGQEIMTRVKPKTVVVFSAH